MCGHFDARFTKLGKTLIHAGFWERHGHTSSSLTVTFIWVRLGQPHCSAKRMVMDTLSRKERSHRMSLIRNRDTKPELLVRRLVFRSGYRYRLHRSDLPGRPDLVFPGRKKVLFVHGCFWHRHPNCGLARLPKSRLSFWLPKLTENRRQRVEKGRVKKC